jgi:hypothetical protein
MKKLFPAKVAPKALRVSDAIDVLISQFSFPFMPVVPLKSDVGNAQPVGKKLSIRKSRSKNT